MRKERNANDLLVQGPLLEYGVQYSKNKTWMIREWKSTAVISTDINKSYS